MATSATSSFLNVRPNLARSRSNTSPHPPRISAPESAGGQNATPARPIHIRSKSYISPVERKAATDPPPGTQEKPEGPRFPRLHFPGKHHHLHPHHSGGEESKGHPRRTHKYGQSETQQYHRKNDSSRTQETPSSTSRPYVDLPPDFSYPSSRGTAIPSLVRMKSSRSYRGEPLQDTASQGGPRLRRANSDPRSPTSTGSSQPTKNTIEIQVEKAEFKRLNAYQTATKSDVDRITAQIDMAKIELSDRLGVTTRAASALVRRLDDKHNMLHRTAESLIDTLSSFSNLAQQSSKLLSNLDVETSNLDSSIRQRIRQLRTQVCTKRAERVAELEERGRRYNEKAELLSRRLDNCRVMVMNWEKRESQKRRAWKGVRNGMIWSAILILIGVLAGVASWKAVQISSGWGTADRVLYQMAKNESWQYDRVADGTGSSIRAASSAAPEANLPADVRILLNEIAERSKNGGNRKVGIPEVDTSKWREKNDRKHDRRLRLLDEL